MRWPEPHLAEALADLERALLVALDRVRALQQHAPSLGDRAPGAVVGTEAHPRDARRALLGPDMDSARDLVGDAPHPAPASSDPVSDDHDVVDALREWRARVAGGRPRYTVCRDEVLAACARARPRTLSALAGLPGVGRAFVNRHGEGLLAALEDAAPAP